jgi:hypothetical protein
MKIEQLKDWLDNGRAAFARYPDLGPLGAWRADGRAYAETREERLECYCYSVGYFEAKDSA